MKNIIVTGAASGFGLLSAQEISKKGHTIYATMRDIANRNAAAAAELRNWAAENHTDIRIVELDVTSDESVEAAVKQIALDTNGQIDVVVNNAGLLIWGLSETLSTSQVEQLFQVNVFGADRINKAVLPYMHKQDSGLLMHLSSGLSRLHLPYLGAYSAAKAAIDTLAETLSYELSKTNIHSVIVQPGAYPTTDMFVKQIAAANPGAELPYGEFAATIKQGIGYLFAETAESPQPLEVAALMAGIIDTPEKHRKIWHPIGLGAGQSVVEDINQSIGQFSLHVQGMVGIN